MPTKQGSHEEEILVSEGMLTIRTREGPGTVAHGRDCRPMGHTHIYAGRVSGKKTAKGTVVEDSRRLWERAPHTGQRAGPGRAQAVAPAES